MSLLHLDTELASMVRHVGAETPTDIQGIPLFDLRDGRVAITKSVWGPRPCRMDVSLDMPTLPLPSLRSLSERCVDEKCPRGLMEVVRKEAMAI